MDFLLYFWVKSIVGGIRMGVHPLVHLCGKTSNAVQGHLIQPLRLHKIGLQDLLIGIIILLTRPQKEPREDEA